MTATMDEERVVVLPAYNPTRTPRTFVSTLPDGTELTTVSERVDQADIADSFVPVTGEMAGELEYQLGCALMALDPNHHYRVVYTLTATITREPENGR